MSVSGFMGYLKGKSSLMLYEQFGDLKFKYRNRELDVYKRQLLTITSQLQQLNGKSGILSQVITLEPEGQVVADALQ